MSTAPIERVDPYAKAREHFTRVSGDHRMQILQDDGVYRHVRFSVPGTGMYRYELVSWPGHLAVSGDLGGGYLFARTNDMFRFFASGPDINPDYWGEKIVNDEARFGIRIYTEEAFRAAVKARLDDLPDYSGLDGADVDEVRAAWNTEAAHNEYPTEVDAFHALEHFGPIGGFRFTDYWEWDLREWNHHYLLSCFAIRAGVRKYLASKGEL